MTAARDTKSPAAYNSLAYQQKQQRDNERRLKHELGISRKLVRLMLARGWRVSVSDGEAWVVHASTSFAVIDLAMRSTDCDVLRAYTSTGERIGHFELVYGNDLDIVSDHTSNAVIDAVAAELQAWVDSRFEV